MAQLRTQNAFKIGPSWHPRSIQQANSWHVQNVHGVVARDAFWGVRGVPREPLSPKNWCLDTTCNPTGSSSLLWTTLAIEMSNIGSQLGPQHGGNELSFSTLEPSWLHLGAILPPKWPQDPPRRHLGAILGPFWYHFGAILVSILEQFWGQNGWKNVPTWLQNSLIKSVAQSLNPSAVAVGGRSRWIYLYSYLII